VSATLATYLTYTQRLLSDPNNQYWSVAELTDDINQARVRVCGDTKCLRQVITGIALTAAQEQYQIASTVSTGTPANLGLYALEVVGVTIYWGTLRVKCQNRSFTEQDAKLRIFQNYQTRPGSLAMMGGVYVYLNPVPDQAYVSDWDVVFAPLPLTSTAQAETIPVVFQPLVPFFAAHLAKYGEQSLSESDIYYKKYLIERQASMYAFFSARWRDAYRR
jgi:hypothetical protein